MLESFCIKDTTTIDPTQIINMIARESSSPICIEEESNGSDTKELKLILLILMRLPVPTTGVNQETTLQYSSCTRKSTCVTSRSNLQANLVEIVLVLTVVVEVVDRIIKDDLVNYIIYIINA